MKLLGVRLNCHDSNLSYYDGTNVHYYKLERESQIKHDWYFREQEWPQVINSVWATVYRLWGATQSDIKEIAIVAESENGCPAAEFPETPYTTFAPNAYRVFHHLAHALSVDLVTRTKPTTYITVDGAGDGGTSWAVFKRNKDLLTLIAQGNAEENGSIGIGMEKLGLELGIKGNGQAGFDIAGKLMGLQSYGRRDQLFFEKTDTLRIRNFVSLFDDQAWMNHKGNLLIAEHTQLDRAKTIHDRLTCILKNFFLEHADPSEVVGYAGGVAQNVIWNTELKSLFPKLVIPPHCADEGLSLGALCWLAIKNKISLPQIPSYPFCQSDEAPKTGPSDAVVEQTAKFLAEGKVVAWYQGNGEIGPRALGHRSILMDPTLKNGHTRINAVKRRESYRPFGASVMSEHKDQWFDGLPDNPYMLYVGVAKNKKLPAITHVDGTCRAQTVKNGTLHKLLQAFYNTTKCPVLLNTSLNLAGKPIAGRVADAKELFKSSSIDVLVVGNDVYTK